MNCSAEYRKAYPITPGSPYNEGFYEDASCKVYDAVLQAITSNGVPRLNCSMYFSQHTNGLSGRHADARAWRAWHGGRLRSTSGDINVGRLPSHANPPSAKCEAELDKLCSVVRAEPELCHECTKGATFPDCTEEDVRDYCPPLPPATRPVSNFTCRFDW
jgi:hypothetical protein